MSRMFRRNWEEILKSCFAAHLNTLVITEDLHEVARDLTLHAPLNLILINENFDPQQHHGFFPRWPMYLLSAKSPETLTQTLKSLKSSDLWNSAASTLFIVSHQNVDGCKDASQILHAAWKMDLLTSFYICAHSESQLLLYTYNPFTSRPMPAWEKVETDLDKRWTLHSRPYSSGPKMCEHLEFDKTKHLDNYQINAVTLTKVGAKPLIGRNDDMTVFKDKSYFSSFLALKNVFRALKITAAINYNSLTEIINGKPVRYLVKLQNGAYDISLFPHFIRNERNFIATRIQTTFAILTKHRDFLTPLEKIANFYSLGAVGLTWLAMFITWLVFLFRNNGRLFSALFEVLRVLLSTSVLQPLRGIPVRIYMFGIWWLVIILNATFQGNIGAFLTKPERFDVETLQDLRRYNYHVYISPIYFDFLHQHLADFPKDNIHVVDDDQCHAYVLKGALTACIQPTVPATFRAAQYNLHVSPLPVDTWIVYFHRPDWPLAKATDKYMSRIAAAGLVEHWQKETYDAPLAKMQDREKRDTDPQIRKIRLSDLTFAFVLLAVGLSLATFFLVLEIYQAKKKPPRKFEITP